MAWRREGKPHIFLCDGKMYVANNRSGLHEYMLAREATTYWNKTGCWPSSAVT